MLYIPIILNFITVSESHYVLYVIVVVFMLHFSKVFVFWNPVFAKVKVNIFEANSVILSIFS
jgi:hypothetical protein